MRIELNTTNWDDFIISGLYKKLEMDNSSSLIHDLVYKHNALVKELKLQDQIQTAVTGGNIKEYGRLKSKKLDLQAQELASQLKYRVIDNIFDENTIDLIDRLRHLVVSRGK